MQKNKLTKSMFSALLLVSTVAGADQQYPAADFQPTIVYQDSNYIAKSNTTTAPAAKTATSSSSATDAKYPAANFQPQVVYSDPKAQASAAPVAAKAHSVNNVSTEVDAKYPAANFQPKVVFSDDKLVSSTSAVVNRATTASVETNTVTSNATVADKPKESDSTYLIALIGLVAAGFFLFKGQEACPAKSKVASAGGAPARTPGGVTGVARYLNRVSGTGVSRYLEKQAKVSTPATGVAKYVARQVISAKAAKAESATGVEKYLRDRS